MRILFCQIQHEIHNGQYHEAVRRLENLELRDRRSRLAERSYHVALPIGLQKGHMLAGFDMHCNQFVR